MRSRRAATEGCVIVLGLIAFSALVVIAPADIETAVDLEEFMDLASDGDDTAKDYQRSSKQVASDFNTSHHHSCIFLAPRSRHPVSPSGRVGVFVCEHDQRSFRGEAAHPQQSHREVRPVVHGIQDGDE
jgi:hypothetical protein